MDLSIVFLALLLILFLLYWFLTKNYNHWQKQNVPTLPNPIIGFGHVLPVLLLKESISNFGKRIYNYTEASMIGFYFMGRPALLVKDIELVKSVLQTNFNSFRNNLVSISEEVDPIAAMNPFITTDPIEWKTARARVTNNLTGKKLSALFLIVKNVCDKMIVYIDRKKDTNGQFECELKSLCLRYTGEIVANAAMAIEGQSFDDNPSPTAFVNLAKTIFDPTLLNSLRQAILFFLPGVSDFFRISFFSKHTRDFFTSVMTTKVSERKKLSSPPYDYLQFSIETNKDGDLNRIIADVVTFYGDTYETSSTTLAFICYYLSRNQDVQDKLRAQVKAAVENTNGKVTYDSLKSMPYLDQIFNETLRLTPALGVLTKVCTQEITLEGSDGIKCHLFPGDTVFVPVSGLHMDTKYWTDPEKFDPDRFSPENKHDRNKFAHLPFGEGPRICVGIRMGMMLVKLAAAELILKYSVKPSLKMKLPLKLVESSVLPYAEGGLWARFEKL